MLWLRVAHSTRVYLGYLGLPSVLTVGGLVALNTSSLHSSPNSSSSGPLDTLKRNFSHLDKTTICEGLKKAPEVQRSNFSNSSESNLRKRMTSVGRFSLLSETVTNPSVPVLVLCLAGKPWNTNDFIRLYNDREMATRHERFRSILATNRKDFLLSPLDNTATRSPKTTLPVKDMIAYPQIYRTELKEMIVDALLSPMDLSRSLWEAWIGTGGKIGQSGAAMPENIKDTSKVESLLLFRAHHCMTDGVSLGGVFADLMDEGESFREALKTHLKTMRKQKKTLWQKLQIFIYYWCWGSIKAIGYHFYLALSAVFFLPTSPWKYLKRIAIENLEQAHLARTLSWVEIASINEVKEIAAYFSEKQQAHSKRKKITINDVFCSCIAGATSKLISHHRKHHNADLSLPYMNLVIPVHMHGGILLPGQSMGNKIGALVNEVPVEAVSRPSERLYQVHNTLWNRKQTPSAVLSFVAASALGGTLGNILGTRLTSWLFSSAHLNASVVVTNVRGPEKAVHLDGREVISNLGFLPLPPDIPIGMAVMSYNGKITLTIMAEPWAVPDADMFLKWVVEEYQSLCQEAQNGRK